jgi:dolichyl-phosphate beta-glucosyltransferase
MAQRRGLRVAEVPVNWTHKPGSRVNLLIDSLRMARDLFIIRFYAITGAYDEPHVASLAEPVVLVAAQSVSAPNR